jgi:hypothetical protein
MEKPSVPVPLPLKGALVWCASPIGRGIGVPPWAARCRLRDRERIGGGDCVVVLDLGVFRDWCSSLVVVRVLSFFSL